MEFPRMSSELDFCICEPIGEVSRDGIVPLTLGCVVCVICHETAHNRSISSNILVGTQTMHENLPMCAVDMPVQLNEMPAY